MNQKEPAEIILDRRGHHAVVTLNREDKQNVLNLALVKSLTRIFSELRVDADVRVVILTGAGDRVFSAGADISELSLLTPDEAKEYSRHGQALTSLIAELGKPVIAAVNGAAIGVGCELAVSCHFRIASSNAAFAQPESKLGLMPGFGGATRLPRLIGPARAFEMILTGERMTADEALKIGLINRIVDDPGRLLQVCEGIATEISLNAPLAIKYALEAVNHGSEMTLEEGLRLESSLFGLCFATEDVNEGTRAFMEKRAAEFKGR